jgi:signal recognition particle GTPase
MQPGVTLETLHQQLKELHAKEIATLSGLAEVTDELRLGLEKLVRILEAMTDEERRNHDLLLDAQVRQRIANQSGTELHDVERLISEATKVGLLMRNLSRMR